MEHHDRQVVGESVLPAGIVRVEQVERLLAGGGRPDAITAAVADGGQQGECSGPDVRGFAGAWSEPVALPASTGLSVAEIPLTGTYVVSGIGKDGNLAIYTADRGTWTAASVDVGGRLLGGEARLAYTTPDAWLLFAAAGGSLLIWSGAGARVAAAPERVKTAAPVRRLLTTYPHAESAMVVFTDTKHNVYSSVGFSDVPVRIPLGEVVAGSAAIDDDRMVHCYGCAPDGRLWQLRQTAWADDDSPVWAPIFPLDTDTTQVSTPVTGFGTLVVTRADGTLDLLGRERTRWTRVPVRNAAAATPTRVSRYRTRLTVSDANGLPCADAAVELTPASLVALESGGRTLIAQPGKATTLTTDGTGVVEFGQHAAGIDSVTFTARVKGAPKPVDVVPHRYLYDVLAGRAPIFNGTTTIPPMSGEMLTTAQVDGEPLVADRKLAGVAAGAVIALIETRERTRSGGDFEVDLQNPDAARFTVLGTPEAATARLAELRPAHAPGLSADLGGWIEDALRAIETGAGRLVRFIVHPDTQTAAAFVESAEGIITLVEGIALAGAAAAGSLIQGVFNALGAAWDKLKDLIQDALHWTSVWRTMDAFDSQLNANLSNVSDLLEYTAVAATGRYFAGLKSQVNTGLDAAAAAFGDVTIGELAKGDLSRLPLPGSGRSSGLSAALPGSPAQNEYVWSKLQVYLPEQLSPVVPALPDGFIARLAKAVEDSGVLDDGMRAALDVMKLFRDPSKPGDVRVADVLAAVRDAADLAADALDILAVILLEVAGEVIRGIRDILNTPVRDAPVLTWFWENVVRPSGNDDPMTLGRLLCLAIAAPVTLACLQERGRGPYDPALTIDTSGLEVALFYDSLALIGVDMIADAANALAAQSNTSDPATTLINFLDFVSNAIVQCATYVTPNLPEKWPTLTTGRKITDVATICYWAPMLVDVMFTGLDILSLGEKPAAAPPGGRAVPRTAQVNLALDMVLGLGLSVAGTVGAGYQYHNGEDGVGSVDIFGALVGPLPWVGQPLLLPQAVDASEGFSLIAQIGIVDPIGDFDYDGPKG